MPSGLCHATVVKPDPGLVCKLQGCNPREGVPKMRADWIKEREVRGDTVFTQMHYARQGQITQEMAFAAAREGLDPEFVRSEVQNAQLIPVCISGGIFCMGPLSLA